MSLTKISGQHLMRLRLDLILLKRDVQVKEELVLRNDEDDVNWDSHQ